MATRTEHSVDVQIRLLTQLGNQLGAFGNQMVGLQSQANRLGQQMTNLFAIHQIEKFGRAASDMFGGIIDKAAIFETAMAKVGIATNSSGAALKEMGDLIQRTSANHLTTVAEAADMMASLGRIGWTSDKIKAMSEPIAQFADVEHQERGMGFDEAAKLSGTISTLYGAKTVAESQRVLDNLYRAMNASPLSPGVLATSLKNFAPVGQKMGMSQESTFQTAAIMGQMGLGSRGGTEMMDILLKLAGGTTSRSGLGARGNQSSKAMRELGMTDEHGHSTVMTNGDFDMLKFTAAVLKASDKLHDHNKVVSDLSEAFGRIGTKLAAAITPQTLDGLKEMMAGWSKTVSLQDAESRILDTLQAQQTLFGSNLTNLATTMGSGALPALKDFNKSLAGITSDMDSWLKAHPSLQKAVGIGMLGGEVLGKGAELAAEGYIIAKMMANGGALPVTIKGGMPGGHDAPGAGSIGIAKKLLPYAGAAGVTAAVVAGAVAALAPPEAYGAAKYDPLAHHSGSRAPRFSYGAKAGAESIPEEQVSNPKLGDVPVVIHVHGTVRDQTITVPSLRAAANRSSGASTSTPSHSAASGFGSD